MSRFRDIYLDKRIPSYPIIASPRWNTDLITLASGAETANQNWSQPFYNFTIPEAIRSMEIYETVIAHWMVVAGPAYTFPFRNPMDFASVALNIPAQVPNISPNDQVIGTGDGLKMNFQIIKKYQRGGFTHYREIYLPVVNTVRVAFNGVEQFSGFSVNRTTGIITFTVPPSTGTAITCGYLYDENVRFESDDSFDAISRNYGIAGYSDLTFIQVPLC